MKKLVLLFSLIVGLGFVSCKKTEINQNQENKKEAHWITPNGYVIPFAEKENWKEYLKTEISNQKANDKRYISQSCILENSDCNLECVETKGKEWDCTKVGACAPCMNCGCSS